MLGEQNGDPPKSQTYSLYEHIYDGTNKTKPKEIARCLFQGACFLVRAHARE